MTTVKWSGVVAEDVCCEDTAGLLWEGCGVTVGTVGEAVV